MKRDKPNTESGIWCRTIMVRGGHRPMLYGLLLSCAVAPCGHAGEAAATLPAGDDAARKAGVPIVSCSAEPGLPGEGLALNRTPGVGVQKRLNSFVTDLLEVRDPVPGSYTVIRSGGDGCTSGLTARAGPALSTSSWTENVCWRARARPCGGWRGARMRCVWA